MQDKLRDAIEGVSLSMYIQRDINKANIKIRAIVAVLRNQASNGYLSITIQTLGVASPSCSLPLASLSVIHTGSKGATKLGLTNLMLLSLLPAYLERPRPGSLLHLSRVLSASAHGLRSGLWLAEGTVLSGSS